MTNGKRIGLALCGSYCTYSAVFEAAARLNEVYDLIPIMSETAAATDTRFGAARDNIRALERLTGHEVIKTIAGAEPLGPAMPLEALLIMPCTGNTLAKLARGITDSAVTMAAKAHLRNGRPLVLALSTNDGLSGSAESIARLLNRKSVYFVPFGQDDAEKKPCSLQADFNLAPAAIEAALNARQLQPLLIPRRG